MTRTRIFAERLITLNQIHATYQAVRPGLPPRTLKVMREVIQQERKWLRRMIG